MAIDSTSGALSGLSGIAAYTSVYDVGTDNLGVVTTPSALLNTKSTDNKSTTVPAAVTAAPAPAPAPAPATETPTAAEIGTVAYSPTNSVVTSPSVTVETGNGETPVSIGTSATNTASSTIKGATEADVTSFKADMAKVDAYVGKTASTPAERAANVLEARKNLSGQKLADFDAKVKPLAQKWGVNLGQPSYVTDGSGLTTSQKAVSSDYTAQFNGTKKAATTTTAPAAETKTSPTTTTSDTPAKHKYTSETTNELFQKVHQLNNPQLAAALRGSSAQSEKSGQVGEVALSQYLGPAAFSEVKSRLMAGHSTSNSPTMSIDEAVSKLRAEDTAAFSQKLTGG